MGRTISKVSILATAAAAVVGTLGLSAGTALASSHREAPITALDRAADITDVYAFVSYDANTAANATPSTVTMIMCVDPLLDPANGPTFFPFDPDVLYEFRIDNNYDAVANIIYQISFVTQFDPQGLGVASPVAEAGIGDAGANDPATGRLTVPPQIRSFDAPGLFLRQFYVVREVRSGQNSVLRSNSTGAGDPLYAVPANAGPRTINYPNLYNAGTYTLDNGIKVFAGTVDDPFFIDLGAAFDTVNLRTLASGTPGVLTAAEDAAAQNFAPDNVSGYAVNAIALQVPITQLTNTGRVEPADSVNSTIGIYCTTSRPRVTVRRSPARNQTSRGSWRQVQRLANPLFNELLIGIGNKDAWSRSVPANDADYADFYLGPLFPKLVEALYGGALSVPPKPRTDLVPLVQYAPPIAAAGTTGPNAAGGPVIADLLRLNTGVPATPISSQSRLGVLGGDNAGYPNGRRLGDDVTDIVLRVVVGGVLADKSTFTFRPGVNDMLGDGVNVNDVAFQTSFPYLGYCPDGRNSRHIDPGEKFPDGRTVPVN